MPGKQITLLDDSQWPGTGFGVRLPIQLETTALCVVDMQRYGLDPTAHLGETVRAHSGELWAAYEQRVEAATAAIRDLLDAFRAAGRRVLYTRHGIHLPDAMDLVVRRRNRERISLSATGGRFGHMAYVGTLAHEIIPELAPAPGELVLDKNTSSAFHTTPIDLYLRNMDIQTIVMTGSATDQCVLATSLDAADRGFHVIIAADACVNHDPGSAEAVLILFGRVWGYVMQTRGIIEWLETGREPARTRLEA
jgi:nicotinamidase-related amidase